MKRIVFLFLAAVVLLGLAGCGETEVPEENLSVTYQKVPICIGAEAGPILEKLGQPKSCTEEPSCAFDGMDKTYYYGSFYLSTCPIDGRDYIYNLWFVDDTVATEEGIRIGSTFAQVEDLWGPEAFDGNSFVRTKGQSRLVIRMEAGMVRSVLYEMLP